MSKNSFHRIGLLGRKISPPVMDSFRVLLSVLQKRGCELYTEPETANLLQGSSAVIVEQDLAALAKRCDLVIVVGGDGSMLGAARQLSKVNIPVLGINRGELGFLTDIASDEIESGVAEVLNGKFSKEERFLLSAQLQRAGKLQAEADAMNEVVVHRGASLRMIEFSLYIDDQFVYSQRSDGLVISTPTGSTAYALSGGGPIVHPALNVISLVPMFPHTLTSRPVVVDGGSRLKIIMGDHKGGQPEMSCDGQSHFLLQSGDEILIEKNSQKLTLVHPASHNFYETCRSKLGWGSRLS